MSDPVTKVNAWYQNLGYQSNRIYKAYPCVTIGLPGSKISCDLYTYNQGKGPYNQLHINSDITGAFFIVYGFTRPIPTGIAVSIHLPKIKIGSIPNVPAWLKLSILEETPSESEPFVELYFKNLTAFTTVPRISIIPTIVPSSLTM